MMNKLVFNSLLVVCCCCAASFVHAADVESTGSVIDVSLEGHGYFQVTDSSGEILYTRDGDWSVDENRQIAVMFADEARQIEPAISIPFDATDIVIHPDGRVEVKIVGTPKLQQVGQIYLANFDNSAGLAKRGDNLFAQTHASRLPIIGTPGDKEFGRVRLTQFQLRAR
jgi:flagellar basal-body rod protein FlgG